MWIPIINLYVPPNGKAILKYERTSNHQIAPELKILGFGFGASGSISFSESIEFSTENIGKLFLLKMLVSARRYISDKGDTLTRLDIDNNQYILPGFVDAHVHIESSMLVPSEFARLAAVHGTVATVSDQKKAEGRGQRAFVRNKLIRL